MAQQFNAQSLPPEAAEQVRVIFNKMMDKVKTEIDELARILMAHGHHFEGFKIGVDEDIHERVPASDLVMGIKQILDFQFGNNQQDILGMIYDPNYNTAIDIAKILDSARKRDHLSMIRELETIIKKLK